MLGIHEDEGFADIADAEAGDGLGGLVVKKMSHIIRKLGALGCHLSQFRRQQPVQIHRIP